MRDDPRAQVEEPVRGALVGVMGRGIALVALLALLALFPVVARPDVQVRDGIAGVALGVLVAYALYVRVAAWHAGRPSDEERARAWERAREIDGEDAALSLLVAGWVPAGLLLAIGLLLWPHLTDPNPALAAAWVVLALPPFVLAWLLATTTWLDACRDDLARAERESDVRLRRYWANPGH
ncbi:MAG TPA: hypothetical protein VES19_08730 [Candidatus Limnocylindrales bacterium]|nr:hypothetical protein [Candidatus Limnocylindrales bacterium]